MIIDVGTSCGSRKQGFPLVRETCILQTMISGKCLEIDTWPAAWYKSGDDLRG